MSATEERWEAVEAGQVRIGDYVRIDHRWFDHPFTRRMFRIGSERELTIMREEKLTRMYVDQSRREAAAAAPGAADSIAAPEDAGAERAAKELAARREALSAAQARDRVTQERALEMLGMLGIGDPDSASTMTGYVDYLVAILNNSTTPLAPLAPMTQRRTTTRLALLGSDAVWLAGTVGKRMRIKGDELRALTIAAAAHAAGLTRMPPHLMDEEANGEFARDPAFRNYPLLSAKILQQCGGFTTDVLRIVLEHRERPDGKGFPRGLKGDAIHPQALVLGAVRELQVRCAGGGTSTAMALAAIYPMLKEVYGTGIANHLAASVLVFPVGTYVQLSDGCIARIVRENEAARLSPVVETFGQNAAEGVPEEVDLSKRDGLYIVRALDTSRVPPRLFDVVRRPRKGEVAANGNGNGNGNGAAKEPAVAEAPAGSVAAKPAATAEVAAAQASGA